MPCGRARRLPDALPDIGDDEDEMLDCTTAPRERGRLSCQLTWGTHVDELDVDLAPGQV